MLRVAVALLRSAVLVLAAGPLMVGDSLSPWEFTLVAAVGVLHVEVGLRTWRARGDNCTGPLMIASGLWWLVNAWGRAALAEMFAEGLLLSACYDPLLLHCSLIIPTGRLRRRRDLMLVTVGYLYWPGVIAAIWLARGMRGPGAADLVSIRALTYPLIGIGLFTFFVARYRAGSAADRRAFGPFWTAVLVNAVTTTALSTTAYHSNSWPTVLYAVGAALVPVGAAMSFARSERLRLIEAGDRERQRVERNVHDGVQQRLLGATLLLRQAERAGDSVLVARGAAEVETAIAELRELVRGLNPPALTRYGLSGAIAAIVEGSPVTVDVDDRLGDARLPEPVAVTAYYVALEAVTNAQKHSGARVVRVSLATEAGRFLVAVQDDGAGGADPVAGGGLDGLRHRVESCGGAFRVISGRGGGTTVRASLPLAYAATGGRR